MRGGKYKLASFLYTQIRTVPLHVIRICLGIRISCHFPLWKLDICHEIRVNDGTIDVVKYVLVTGG